jgi:pimeloyl-ACP methyl ester carboxylesterase
MTPPSADASDRAAAPGPLQPDTPLPPGVLSRFVDGVNGLRMHVLEAGADADTAAPGRPLLLLLHGFPELAYSWRHLMPGLAALGYHVVAPDQRGYGRTTGWSRGYDVDLREFGMFNLVHDTLALVAALGQHRVAAVLGHDFGSPVAAWCALIRPDVFPAAVLMSAPFAGPPALGPATAAAAGAAELDAALAALPRPRKHYQSYYGTRTADADMRHAPQGLAAFLRAYFHVKSADGSGHAPTPAPLPSRQAASYAQLPTYYVMDLAADMPTTVAAQAPTTAESAACHWLQAAELQFVSQEYARCGFQGGLQWYRAARDPGCIAQLQVFAGRRLDVPTMYLAGYSDWGMFQKPGDLETMTTQACPQLRGCHRVPGAGHWVQQEQPAAVLAHVADFLRSLSSAP